MSDELADFAGIFHALGDGQGCIIYEQVCNVDMVFTADLQINWSNAAHMIYVGICTDRMEKIEAGRTVATSQEEVEVAARRLYDQGVETLIIYEEHESCDHVTVFRRTERVAKDEWRVQGWTFGRTADLIPFAKRIIDFRINQLGPEAQAVLPEFLKKSNQRLQ